MNVVVVCARWCWILAVGWWWWWLWVVGDGAGGLCWLVVSVVFLDDGIYGGWSCVDGGE